MHPWWTKITRYDKEFLPAITRVLSNVIRVVEDRLAKTDLSPLVFRDIPMLVTTHFDDYRNAQAKLQTSYATGGAATLPQLFHQLQPHMAISPDGIVDEAYIRQALDDVLKTCLPPADYEPETERYIVREIMVKVVQDGVIPKVTQPWFIHQTILNLLGPEKRKQTESADTVVESVPSPQRPPLRRTSSHSLSLHSLLIFVLSTIRSVSGACLAIMHAYRNARDTIKKVNQSKVVYPSLSTENEAERPKKTIPGSLLPMSPIPEPAAYAPASPPPSPPPSPPTISVSDSTTSTIPPLSSIPTSAPPQPDYVHPVLQLISSILAPPRTPATPPRSVPLALTHLLTLLLTPFTSTLSRLLPYLLYTHAFSSDSLLAILQSTRNALFPGGWPAQSPPDPTPEEQAELRRELARRLLALVPGPCLPVLGATPGARAQAIDAVLDPLSSQACNAHLIVFVLDLVLLTLFPEMGVALPSAVPDPGIEGARTPGSLESVPGTLTPPRPDSRPP